MDELTGHIANPYHPPRPGSDDPHQGVDYAIIEPANRIALAGATVQAVLPGRAAAVIADRFPYGNAILIETPLEDLPPDWLERLALPTPAPTLPPNPALTCPTADASPAWDASRRSLYLLYAHMQALPTVLQGDLVDCGQALGAIGQSGNALNPHLHLEARLGPAGARFESLAHYDNSATPAEMSAYCTWRVSGIFQLVDPTRLFAEGDK